MNVPGVAVHAIVLCQTAVVLQFVLRVLVVQKPVHVKTGLGLAVRVLSIGDISHFRSLPDLYEFFFGSGVPKFDNEDSQRPDNEDSEKL